jgi:transcriptional regulator with XRE-family HTH domain
MSQPSMPQPNGIPSLKPHKRVYGTIIRQKREQQGLSQEDMAQLLNMSHNGYWKIENDQTKLTAETMENIATILKTDATEFLQGDYSKYRIRQTNHNHDQSSGLIINKYEFETERKVWEGYVKSQQETIEAKNQALTAQNALILAKEETIEVFRLMMQTKTDL